jgi:23S rRNA (pseudouridine1915-N3)-methyltransferase
MLLAVGRMKAGPERELYERYSRRASEIARSAGVAAFETREIDEGRARRPEGRRAEESRDLLAQIGRDARLVVLDERGKSVSSADFAAAIGAARDAGSDYALIVGGPDGHDPALRARAHGVIAFGGMTWPHQLARVMAAEQLYRALTILIGHPYHRA